MNLITLLAVLFIALKLLHLIAWPWWLVLTPIWVPLAWWIFWTTISLICTLLVWLSKSPLERSIDRMISALQRSGH